ncbi:DJ-1/PfpI family protein [Micromonospora sp. WMMD1102]|uniref:DJ-1/PfpI family protein n=1 Tax=Micromonospora sp. WMMD1102 TaxID=3016105 RepID=UPI0024156099|nr:DJ-1/PfpI family protein [Micromonospora sp. WMMD1102]MDG4786730.1 DJ-1/PfpI family protein [Micromonospora sp. WMMD1102]
MRIVIPLFERFTALDAVGPYDVLKLLPDADVVFAATSPGPVRNTAGTLALTADAALADIDSCDVLVVPGGAVRDQLGGGELVDWIRRVQGTARWTTSVCTGSLLLGAAGLLRGRTATTHWGSAERLASFGATYTAQRVVEDGTLITAAGVSAGIDMALTLAARLTDRTTAEAIQLAIEYDPQPPFDTGSPAKAPQVVRDRYAAGFRTTARPEAAAAPEFAAAPGSAPHPPGGPGSQL